MAGLDLGNKALKIDDGNTQVSYATAYMQGYENDDEFSMLDKKMKKSKGEFSQKNWSLGQKKIASNQEDEELKDSRKVKSKVMKLIKNAENEWEWVEDDLFDQGDETGSVEEEDEGLLADEKQDSEAKKGPNASYSKAFKQEDNNDSAWTNLVRTIECTFKMLEKEKREGAEAAGKSKQGTNEEGKNSENSTR